jgi:hypothetical protein
MQPRNQNHRHGLIATVPLALLLAACTTTAATTAHSSSSAPTPSPSGNPTTPTPTLVPTPSPTAAPTPAPEPPLAVLSQGQELKVVNTQGVEQFELSNAAMMTIFGVSATQEVTQGFGINSAIAGSNIYLFYETPQGVHRVAEISRAGKVIAMGTAPSSAVVFSPSGTQWAWSVDQSPANELNNLGPGPPYYQHHGVIDVGGLGQPTRTVYKWVAPAGFTEGLDGWTNTGIIVQRWEYGGCGILYDPAAAWFALNPSTGKLTELFTGNDQFMGASSGVTVAALINDAHAVLINAVRYAESKSTITGANISPDGAHVAVSRISSYQGCAGYIPKNTVELVTVANQSHVDLQNLTADGWWSDTEFVASPLDGSTWLYTLAGKQVSEICSTTSGWGYSGELS